ncbi:hypothetical protein AVEN_257882-1 [Araneus ventricosus]|uniref:DUF4817 domain-containing protein n=1 Tax=Araneus ventricosus TaxID=182803 RepID=A0A4Y2C2Z3_ARAVE|nr:hypothetical protein AVEN_257882-1 [Araneus ventricosus]
MKKGVGPMTVQGLLKMIQKFEKTGSFSVQSGRGRKRIDSTVVEEVATAVQEVSSGGVQPCSAREIARTLDRPVSTVHKILRNILHCYPYKISHAPSVAKIWNYFFSYAIRFPPSSIIFRSNLASF